MRVIGANSETKKPPASLLGLQTDSIDGRGLCTLIYSVRPTKWAGTCAIRPQIHLAEELLWSDSPAELSVSLVVHLTMKLIIAINLL